MSALNFVRHPEMLLVMALEVGLMTSIMIISGGKPAVLLLLMIFSLTCSLRGQRVYRLSSEAAGGASSQETGK